MKINFALHGAPLCGGNRVIFEVANNLTDRGHKVTITTVGRKGEHKWFPLKAKISYVPPYGILDYPFAVNTFVLRSLGLGNINQVLDLERFRWQSNILAKRILECDINVATHCLTAFAVKESGKGRPFYFVQHYEPLFFAGNVFLRTIAEKTYYLPLKKLVVSRWLERLIEKKTRERPIYVGNAINLKMFHPRHIEKNNKEKVVMAFFRGIRWKGEREVLEALNIVSKRFSNLKLLGVGNWKVFKNLVKTLPIKYSFKFVDSPGDERLVELYCLADIFVQASWFEGWSLPPIEAMACGTPVVSTDNLGIRDYAINEYNALIVPPKNTCKLAEAVERLLSDADLSEALKKKGLETSKEYTYEKLVDRVEKAFKEAVDI